MKDIESKYIVQYYLSFVEKGKLYICMEYCSGGDLAQYLRAQKGKPLN
jgi:NIMA (never in mitosis gene a)-related kinase